MSGWTQVEFGTLPCYDSAMSCRVTSNPLLAALLALLVMVASAPFVDAHGDDGANHVVAGVYLDIDGDAGSPAPSPVDSSGSSHIHIHACCPHVETTSFRNGIVPMHTPLLFRTARNRGSLPPGFYRLPLRPPSLTI